MQQFMLSSSVVSIYLALLLICNVQCLPASLRKSAKRDTRNEISHNNDRGDVEMAAPLGNGQQRLERGTGERHHVPESKSVQSKTRKAIKRDTSYGNENIVFQNRPEGKAGFRKPARQHLAVDTMESGPVRSKKFVKSAGGDTGVAHPHRSGGRERLSGMKQQQREMQAGNNVNARGQRNHRGSDGANGILRNDQQLNAAERMRNELRSGPQAQQVLPDKEAAAGQHIPQHHDDLADTQQKSMPQHEERMMQPHSSDQFAGGNDGRQGDHVANGGQFAGGNDGRQGDHIANGGQFTGGNDGRQGDHISNGGQFAGGNDGRQGDHIANGGQFAGGNDGHRGDHIANGGQFAGGNDGRQGDHIADGGQFAGGNDGHEGDHIANGGQFTGGNDGHQGDHVANDGQFAGADSGRQGDHFVSNDQNHERSVPHERPGAADHHESELRGQHDTDDLAGGDEKEPRNAEPAHLEVAPIQDNIPVADANVNMHVQDALSDISKMQKEEEEEEEEPSEVEMMPQDHIVGMPLERDGDSNPAFHREALFGKDLQNAGQMNEGRLRVIFAEADGDGDQQLDDKELGQWIHAKSMQHVQTAQDTNRADFHHVDKDGDEELTWKEYAHHIRHMKQSDIEHHAPKRLSTSIWNDLQNNRRKNHGMNFADANKAHIRTGNSTLQRLLVRDLHRWRSADTDGDMKLGQDEFFTFRHPEYNGAALMQFVREVISELDQNGDGVLTVDEYVDQNHAKRGRLANGFNKKGRQRQFTELIDMDSDGTATSEEIAQFLDPMSAQSSINNALFLIHAVDDDKNGRVSWEEVVAHKDLFLDHHPNSIVSRSHNEL